MRVEQDRDPDVIDRRHGIIARIGMGIACIFTAAAGYFGSRCYMVTQDPEAPLLAVVNTTVKDVQVFWGHEVPSYAPAQVVLYRGAAATKCGRGLYADGPFYCPKDARVYLDLGFLTHVRGDLARAYVVAHELGHHVEALRGKPGVGRAAELEADCLAGAWIGDARARGVVAGDEIDGALAAAADAGDDRLRPGSAPESWTHGSSTERVAAVRAGIVGGATACLAP